MAERADIVLIHPPAALPCQPAPAPALLAGRLRAAGARVRVVDANVEALHGLIMGPRLEDAVETSQRRALGQRERSLEQLTSRAAYENRDRHHNAVSALRQVLRLAAGPDSDHIPDLAQYTHLVRSPMRSGDLLAAAADPDDSPYAAYTAALARELADAPPRVVGLSVGYLHQALPAMAMAGALRRVLPASTRVVMGGALLGCWQGRLDPGGLAPSVDRVFFGDGAAPLLEEAGLPLPAPGVLAAAEPDFSDSPWDLYLAPGRILPMATSEGCFWGRCSYCPEAVARTPFELHHGDALARVLERLWSETGASLIHLSDSAVPPTCLEQLSRQRWPLSWYGFTRFHPALAQPEVARGLRASGCRVLQLGLESGSPAVLRRLNKGITPDLASRVLRALGEAGVPVYLYIMFGVPGETEADAEQTMAFVAEHARHIAFVNTSLLNLPLASPPEPNLRRIPFPQEKDLTLYSDFLDDSGMDRRAARRFLERRFARHPDVAPLLRRTPLVFGANHAPFMV